MNITEAIETEKRRIGFIPAFAVTPEMLANPKLMLSSPFFVEASDEAPDGADEDEDQECGCCPCCGCTCSDED